jgi:hypothetical protein
MGMIGMPFSWEEQEEIALMQAGLLHTGTVENAFSLGKIEQLIFIQFTSFAQLEIITVGMSAGRISFTGGNLLISYGTDSESPEFITLVG